MKPIILYSSFMVLLAGSCLEAADPATFRTDIQPLVQKYCLRCHNVDKMTSGIRVDQLDGSLEEAAMDLGASRLGTFVHITLPIITPALVSGWLLAFTLSLDDLVIASFVAGPSSTTLPMIVFSSVRMGLSPQINALATLLILAVSLVALFAYWIMMRDERRRRMDKALMD